jgi:PBP1b-binding outer membrane lipoprotein LpoB
MKNVIYLFLTTLILSSCSSEVDSAKVVAEEPKTPITEQETEAPTYLLGDVKVKWSAFKHISKAIVGGEFDEINVTNFKDSSDLYNSVEGLLFQLDVNSTKTGDTLRDYKIYTSFFGTMLNTQFITGEIVSLNKNKTGMVSITMNDVSKEVGFTWDIDQRHEFFLKTSIDVFDWNANSSLEALNNVCLEKHTGPDGINKLWPNVDIVVIAKLIPTN